jgi:pimeloyl-ACP methyl ester carboxylesterase
VDAPRFAPSVRVPLLSILARDDPNISVSQVRRELEAAPVNDKRLVLLPGSAHGVTLLEADGDGATPLTGTVEAWIRARA